MIKRYGEDAPSLEELAETRARDKHDIKTKEGELIDELGCDDFALHVLQVYCELRTIAPLEIYKAAFLALRHVRAINYLRAFVRQLDSGEEISGIDDRVRLLQLRQRQLRTAFSMIIGNPRSGKNRARMKAAQDAISDLSDLHDNNLDNVILFELIPNLPFEFREWQRLHKQELRMEDLTIDMIAALRGWFSRLSDAPLVSMSPSTLRLQTEEEGETMTREPEQATRLIKVGRNDPCPCGSGMKYKKCCLNETNRV